jgi:type IV pilus assembly protein PilY1
MKKIIKFAVVFIALAVITCLTPLNLYAVCADEQELFTEGSSYMPNVLIILDNSQSMDEDFNGNLVGPWATGSRLVEAKRAMQLIANKYANSMRIGLMTYKLSGVSDYDVHNAVYFASYEPKSYCPNPPAECQDYCKTDNAGNQATCQASCAAQNAAFDATYRDEIIPYYAVGSEQRNRYCNLVYPKTNSYPNPVDTSHNIYYKLPGTFYAGSNYGTKFGYAGSYNPNETVADGYHLYSTKIGTNDGSYSGSNPGQYSNYYATWNFTPTDEDIALGFKDFGRRMAWYYVGKTWFAAGSPGPGYLHVAADTNNASNTQLNKLLAKLAFSPTYPTTTVTGSENDYMTCSSGNTCSYIVNAGLTPIAGTLQTAIDYFKGTGYTSPIQDSCQKNFVIFVTDGLPSVNTSGTKGTAASLMPDVLTKIDKLRAVTKKIGATNYTFNILTFVVGMALTADAKPYLDTMASRGGTAVDGQALYADNAAGIATALDNIMSNIISRAYSFATSSISASRTADENYLYEATFEPVSTSPFWKGYLKKWSLGSDGSMYQVVWEAGNKLQSISAASRNMKTLIGGNLVNFKSSDIDTSTPVPYTNMTFAADTTSTKIVTNQTTADKVIKFIRGYATDPADGTVLNPINWKLGDVFHSSPITLGTPSPFYYDVIDKNDSFAAYRSAHPRASSDGTRMLIAGANDGQFHAFLTSTGNEFWSFIPPNLLPKLQDIYYTTASSTLEHRFFVDGTIMAMDSWLPSSLSDGTAKNSADWRTLVMFSLGRNDCDYTNTDKTAVRQSTKYWATTGSNCSSGLQEKWDATHLNYCGYYAFDFTDTPGSDPSFKWTLKPTATEAPYLGEPWSTISPGRVKIAGMERWIGVIGGGYNGELASADKRGKGIIVFDLRDGTPIWSYTYSDNANMNYSIASQVTLVDSDNDNYIDRAYVGDIKGDMWQLKFCTKAELTSNPSCGTSSWKGSLLLTLDGGSDKFPVYYPPNLAWDSNKNLWLYWATGDKIDPNGGGPAAWVYGLKALLCTNTDGTPKPCARDFANITSEENTYCGETTTGTVGWAINLAGQGEQVLSQPTAFNKVLYFTSFTPSLGSSADCTKTGQSNLYALSIDPGTSESTCTAGKGLIDSLGARSQPIGAGIASGATISYGPGGSTPNLYYTVSGAGGQEGGTLLSDFVVPAPGNLTNTLFWKDRRLE